MLTAEVIGTGRTTGEVRPARCKMGWNCAAGAGQGSRDGDYAAMEATVAPCCLPVGLDFGYSAVSRGRMGLPYGKCQINVSGLARLPMAIFCTIIKMRVMTLQKTEFQVIEEFY
jgi:hypothetical protein